MNPRRFWLRLKRAWSLLRWYWVTGDNDWEVIARLLSHQIRRIRLHIDQHEFFVGYERCVRQMLIAEYLLERIIEDAAYDQASARFPDSEHHPRRWAERVKEIEEQDMEMLTEILRKHLQSWWC